MVAFIFKFSKLANKVDKQIDSNLHNILIDQTNECNKQFSKYIEDSYETIVKILRAQY